MKKLGVLLGIFLMFILSLQNTLSIQTLNEFINESTEFNQTYNEQLNYTFQFNLSENSNIFYNSSFNINNYELNAEEEDGVTISSSPYYTFSAGNAYIQDSNNFCKYDYIQNNIYYYTGGGSEPIQSRSFTRLTKSYTYSQKSDPFTTNFVIGYSYDSNDGFRIMYPSETAYQTIYCYNLNQIKSNLSNIKIYINNINIQNITNINELKIINISNEYLTKGINNITIISDTKGILEISDLEINFDNYFQIKTNLENYNITINNTTYESNNSIYITNILSNDNHLYNINLSSYGYIIQNFTNYNISNNIETNFIVNYQLYNITYNNIYNYSDNEYIRNLSTTFELFCDQRTNIEILIDNISKKNESLLCNSNIKNYTIYYQTEQEGYQTITYNITSDIWNNITSKSLYWDLFDPIILSNYTLNNTFGNIINISTLCYDNITPLLVYNITFNNNIYYGNQSNNTLINNQTTLIDGNNDFIVKCSDFFGTTTTNESIDATVKTIQLIDERTGLNFNLNSTEKVFVYFSDTNYYSFTSPFVNISSINNTNLRFELEYLDTIITRYIDMSLIDDQNIRVCVSREGTTFYNQDIISATTKPALLKSSFADCYVLAYPLSFAYQDAYSVKAYTTPTLYYLYTKDKGKDVLLASFDGAQDSYVNLDTLEFSKTSYQVSLLADALSIDIDRNNNNVLIIYYQNIENENTNIRMVITDENGVVLVDTDELNPNEFTTYFNFNSYEITDKTLFKVTLTKTKEDGTISEQSKFFDPMGKSGTIQPTFAAILAVLFLFFSLTIVIPRLSLSWLGLLFEIITLLILSFAVPVWYINFLVAINVIILVYTFFMMSQINYPTVVS